MEKIRFRTGTRTSYVVEVPEGTLAAIWAAEDWQAAAMKVFDDAVVIREDFRGDGATLPSSSNELPAEWRAHRRALVKKWISTDHLPVATSN